MNYINKSHVFKLFLLFTVIDLLLSFTLVTADGLPGEFLISDQWKTLFKNITPMSNPALMMENTSVSFRGVGSLSHDDISRLWEAGVIIPLGYYHSIGITAVGENGGDVIDAGENYLESNVGVTGNVSRNNNYLFSTSYATNPIGKLSLGVNLNWLYQSNFGQPEFGFGADIGTTYRILLHPVLGFHLAGITFQNLFSTKLDIDKEMGYSAQIKALYHTSFLQNKFEFDIQCDLTDFLAKSELFADNKGSEWNIFFLGGVWILPVFQIKAFCEIREPKELDYWGLGFNFNVPQLNSGRDFSVMYHIRNEVKSNIAASHSLYLKVDLGNNREEFAVVKIAKKIGLTANELYNRAMKLYYKGNYWDAYITYVRLLVEYPDFFKNDYVMYYSGSCMEHLDMREEAIKAYQNVRGLYSESQANSIADLGLMRVFYRQEDYAGVSRSYVELNRPAISDSLRFHGSYIMGESFLRQADQIKALTYLQTIPEDHPDYIFAQFSSAVAYAQLNSDIQLITSSLENCISASVNDAPQKEIANRALVYLGYLYYEEDALSKAVTVLRMVPSESYYREDALLGLGWTAIKARQWADCINSGLQLAQESKRFIMQAEGALLQSYGHILEKRYDYAKLLLEPMINRMQQYPGLLSDSLSISKMRYESNRIKYAFFSERIADMARRGGNVKQQEIDSLHSEQIMQKERIDQYIMFADEFQRTTFFERNLASIKEDLEYVLAKVHKLMNSTSNLKNREKIMSKEKAISDEIDKLKEEMDRIQE